jgi:hypothetical protein
MWTSTITSGFAFGVTLQSGGVIALHENSFITGSIASTGGQVWAWDSEIDGSLTGMYDTLWVENSTVLGDVWLADSQASWMHARIDSTLPVFLSSSTLLAEWTTLAFVGDYALELTNGSIGTLRGLTSAPVMVDAGSSASVWRMVDFSVSDLSGIPIPAASVAARFSLNSTLVSTVSTDLNGAASGWLLTDLLYGGVSQYVGSYHFTATFSTYHADVIENLPFYPQLNDDVNLVRIDLIFPVINPTDLFTDTTGQQVVSGLWDLVDFRQDGNLYVRGVLNINGSFTLDQDRDFQKAIVADSGSINLGPSASITSPYKFNIYLFNSSSLNANGGVLDLNAIVTFGNSAVTIGGGALVRSSFILGGTSFQLGSGVSATGAQLYARGGTTVIIEGATVSFSKVDVLTDGSVSVNDSAVTVFSNVALRSTGAQKTVSIHNSLISGSDLALEGASIDIAGSQFLVSSVSRMWGDVVQVWTTSFFAPLTGFKGGSTASLYDVVYPSIMVDPSAIVVIQHKLSFGAIDSNQNAITVGTWVITHLPDGGTIDQGALSVVVERNLVASRIVGGVETFEGNYKVDMSTAGGDATRYVVMDQARTLMVLYPGEIVSPSALILVASADPAEFVQGSPITVAGTVGLSFEGRGSLLAPSGPAEIQLAWNGSTFATVATGPDGSFSWTGSFAPDANFFGLTLINITASYKTVTGRASIAVNVTESPPTALIIFLDHDRFEKGTNENFVISGSVRYSNGKPAANARIRVTFTIPPQAGEYTAVVDGAGLFDVNIPGRRTASTYSLVVNSHDDRFTLDAPAKTVTLTVSTVVAGPGGGGLGGLTSYILIGAAAAAGVVAIAIVVNAKRKSVNYVECGNCGRPAHEGDKRCPSCGVEFEEDIAKCSHCASWIPSNAVRCPKCNTEFKPVDEALASEPTAVPENAAPEGIKAEVTTTAVPQKAPVAVKKKVLKTAEPTGEPKKDEFANPWDAAASPPEPKPAEQPKPAPEKKPEDKKEKGLFDDL